MWKVHKFLTLFNILFASIQLGVSDDPQYSYEDPDSWKNNFPMCRSDPQSPINIETSWVTNGNVGCPSIQYLNYDTPANSMKLKNNGNGITLKAMFSETPKIQANNALFSGTYKFVSYRFHWAEFTLNGTEHAFNSQKFSAEGHALHLNTKYDSLEEASKNEDGILALATFYGVRGSEDQSSLAPLRSSLPQVQEINSSADVNPPVSLNDLKIGCQNYLTYMGSTVIPPCYGNVRWILCSNNVPVTDDDLSLLQQTKLIGGVTHNTRPLQSSPNQNVKVVSCQKKRQRG